MKNQKLTKNKDMCMYMNDYLKGRKNPRCVNSVNKRKKSSTLKLSQYHLVNDFKINYVFGRYTGISTQHSCACKSNNYLVFSGILLPDCL